MNKRILATLLALVMALALLPAPALGAEPNLDAIAYVVGDRAECKMDAAMANAYIEAIRQAKADMLVDEYYENDGRDLYVALADIAGDGYPILITAVLDKSWEAITDQNLTDEDLSEVYGAFPMYGANCIDFWGYKDGVAYNANVPVGYECGYGRKGNVGMMYYQDFFHEFGYNPIRSVIFSVSKGEITQTFEMVNYAVSCYENPDVGEGGFPKGGVYASYTTEYDENPYGWGKVPVSVLQENGWLKDKSDCWELVLDNGVNVTQAIMDEGGSFFSFYKKVDEYDENVGSFVMIWDACDCITIDTTPADEAIAALQGLAAAPVVPTYKVILRLDTGDVSVDTAQGQPMTVPTNPTKEGYTFGGWYLDAALTQPWNFNTVVTGDMELYGKWTPLTSTAAATGRSGQSITVNGAPVKLEAYTLAADSNGGDVTFVKLRDVAAVLEGTEDQFNVEWKNGGIYVVTKSAYTTKNSTELQPIVVNTTGYKQNTAPVLFDGYLKSLEGIVITDVEGGGHTFFKLRDLSDAIGFTVDWSAERGIYIETA